MKTLVNRLIVVICLLSLIPSVGFSAQARTEKTSLTATSMVSVNSATAEQLQALSGIGEVTARRIIDYRAANGPFDQVEDLLDVKGIGPGTLDRIREHISVN
ncbi:MAG: competence protein ComEA [Desulfuromonadales bacterium]|jgi:competence protein ComEA|nr:competence protein ComEA [Desulfuromonadales bacterium]